MLSQQSKDYITKTFPGLSIRVREEPCPEGKRVLVAFFTGKGAYVIDGCPCDDTGMAKRFEGEGQWETWPPPA